MVMSSTYTFKKVLKQQVKSISRQNNPAQSITSFSKQNHFVYQIKSYQRINDNSQQFIQSAQFTIKHYYQDYLKAFTRIQHDFIRIYNQKDRKMDKEEIWRDLRLDLIENHFQIKTQFTKIQAQLTFRIFIKNQYDFKYQIWEQANFKKKKLLQEKKKQNSVGAAKAKFTNSEVSINLQQNQFESLKNSKVQNVENEINLNINKKASYIQINQQLSPLQQSEIKIIDPEGVYVTNDPDNNTFNDRQRFYPFKKSSMLSDIQQQSYQGSSNRNIQKSALGDLIKALDQIHQQPQSMFSPIIKTQNFQSHKFDQMFEPIKRRVTLQHLTSNQIEFFQKQRNLSEKNRFIKQQDQYIPDIRLQNQITKHQKIQNKKTQNCQIRSFQSRTLDSPNKLSKNNSWSVDVKQEELTKSNLIKIALKLLVFYILVILFAYLATNVSSFSNQKPVQKVKKIKMQTLQKSTSQKKK